MLVTEAASTPRNGAECVSAQCDIKSILFHVHDDDHLEQQLQAALSIARACSAHLQLLHVVPIEAYTFVDTYGGTNLSAQLVEALEEQARAVQANVERRLRNEDVSWDYHALTFPIAAAVIGHASLADLVIVGRQPRAPDFGHGGSYPIHRLIAESRTPILIPGDQAPIADLDGPAVIAWNGSVEAANAVRGAIGLLKLAPQVKVVRFVESKSAQFPNTQLLEYLSRHGIHADFDERQTIYSAAVDIVAYARSQGCAYLVMGGYSHSRAGEFLFGGVTRDLLRECPVSIVTMH